jgi:protoheme IX farnesyltransferase
MSENKKLSTYGIVSALFKLRLTSLVVFSSLIGYVFYGFPNFDGIGLLWLSLAGILVTGAANAFNQIIERKTDKLMDRTKLRPIPNGDISWQSALIIATASAISGLFILYKIFNENAFYIGLASIVSYAFIYTPMKRISPWAVFVGAFPGAAPPLLGYVAASGIFDMSGGLLFVTQFIWQFPHFWAIAWCLEEDYSLGGFSLLPSLGGRNKSSAFQILIYSLFTVPIGMLPWVFDLCGSWYMITSILLGLYMTFYAFKLYFSCDTKQARKLMFSSFLYLPVLQIMFIIDKL